MFLNSFLTTLKSFLSISFLSVGYQRRSGIPGFVFFSGNGIGYSMEGNRCALKVIFHLDKHIFIKLPPRLQAGGGVKLIPILINHGTDLFLSQVYFSLLNSFIELIFYLVLWQAKLLLEREKEITFNSAML